MKTKINEVQKLQKIAGILKENVNERAYGYGNEKAEKLAQYVWYNYEKITCLDDSAKTDEGEFPRKILDMIEKRGRGNRAIDR